MQRLQPCPEPQLCAGCRLHCRRGGFLDPTFRRASAKRRFFRKPVRSSTPRPQLDVYGFASSSSSISLADLVSPTFLGTLTLPPGLGYGQDVFFDVTQFLQTVQTPYVDIVLENSGGTDVFSSTQYNYGHPSQLTVVTPEPASGALLLLGIPFAHLLLKVRKSAAC
jgi:hypothetical protein